MNNISGQGKAFLQTDSVQDFLEVEITSGIHEQFAGIDALLTRFFHAMISGKRILEFDLIDKKQGRIRLQKLSSEDRFIIEHLYSLSAIQSRGTWSLAKDVSISVGLMHLPFYFQQYPRYAHSLSSAEKYKCSLEHDPSAVFTWSLIEPLCSLLFFPLVLRGPSAGLISEEKQQQQWQMFDILIEAMELEIEEHLSLFHSGKNWQALDIEQRILAKQHLLQALHEQIAEKADIGVRYRIFCLRTLIERYYQKAKKGKAVKRKDIISKAFESVLTGFFGGDWLAFLDYIGESSHPDEQIITALPDIHLQVEVQQSPAQVAYEMGLPVEEVQQILAAYWQQPDTVSPVEKRVQALKRYWQAFDIIHACQQSTMPHLWGFVEDERRYYCSPRTSSMPTSLFYKQLLPSSVTQEIEDLWGASVVSRWPEQITNDPFAHNLMAETFGVALSFWHGCALTVWFHSEGPSSRTDIQNMRNYYHKELQFLEELGTPVDLRLFDQLERAERRIKPQTVYEQTSDKKINTAISLQITSYSVHNGGFQIYRDILTENRRKWTEKYLDPYLRKRWEDEIYQVASTHAHWLNKYQKQPTLKQFAKFGAATANHWFAGDLDKLYATIRVKSPQQQTQRPYLAYNHYALVCHLFQRFQRLGRLSSSSLQEDGMQLESLANLGLKFVHLAEAKQAQPTIEELGRNVFTQVAFCLHPDVEQAWNRFVQGIEEGKNELLYLSSSQEEGTRVPAFEQIMLPRIEKEPIKPEQKRAWWQKLFGR